MFRRPDASTPGAVLYVCLMRNQMPDVGGRGPFCTGPVMAVYVNLNIRNSILIFSVQ